MNSGDEESAAPTEDYRAFLEQRLGACRSGDRPLHPRVFSQSIGGLSLPLAMLNPTRKNRFVMLLAAILSEEELDLIHTDSEFGDAWREFVQRTWRRYWLDTVLSPAKYIVALVLFAFWLKHCW